MSGTLLRREHTVPAANTHGLPTGRCYGYGDMEYLVLAVSSSGVGSHRVTVYLPVDVRYTVQM